MGNTELRFLYELLMKKEELTLYHAVLDKPLDSGCRAIYADYLEEQGRMESAKIIRSYSHSTTVPGLSFNFSSGAAWGTRPTFPIPSGYRYPDIPSGYTHAAGPCGSISMPPVVINSGSGSYLAYGASGQVQWAHFPVPSGQINWSWDFVITA